MNITNDLKVLIEEYEALLSARDDIGKLYGNSSINFNSIEDAINEQIDATDLNVTILKINIDTGCYINKSFYTIGSENDDLMGLIDKYATDKDCTLKFYEIDEIIEICETTEFYKDAYFNESFLPINGGTCYTDMLSSTEEFLFYDFYKLYKEGVSND